VKTPDWTAIRQHYRANTQAIYEAGRSMWGIDPYAWEHETDIRLTPIERALWSDIRAVGVVMYPQYPVSRYFVDFANPVARVAIECDGALWHLDAEKDRKRQCEIEAEGWTVYRISGSECLKEGQEVEDESGRRAYRSSEAFRLIRDIAEKHGIRLWSPRPGRIRAASSYRGELLQEFEFA